MADYTKEEYKDAFVIQKQNKLLYEEYYVCYTLLELAAKLNDMLENEEFASYRVLYDNNVKWFIFGQEGLTYYVDNYKHLLKTELKLNKAHNAGVTKEGVKEVEKAQGDYELVDLENLNVYNGVEQEYPSKPYPECLMEYHDFLIKEEEKALNQRAEEEVDEILEITQYKVLKMHQNFYV